MAKVMISMPDDLLGRLDAEARRRSLTRSAFLRQAVSRELGRRDPGVVHEAIEDMDRLARKHGGWNDGKDSATLIREQRDALDRRDRDRLRRLSST